MRAHLGVALAQILDATHAAHDGRVIAATEGAADFGEAAPERMLAQVHRHVARERDAAVALLAHELRVGDAE